MNNNKYIKPSFAFVLFIALFTAPSCKKEVAAPAKVDYSLSEVFNSLSDAQANGWVFINNSRNLGETTWQPGDGSLFPGYSTDAAASDYVSIAASCSYPFDADGNLDSTTEISAWMITPVLTVKNNDIVSFFTRTTDTEAYIPERLELRMNQAGTSADVGSDSSSVGDFTQTVLTINPTLNFGVYPNTWTKYQYTISGLTAQTKTRFAFRYHKPINTLGAAGFYYQLGYIGIDNFSFTSF
jgi:hypothetical protein